jgi:hypothetical protein
MKLLEIIILGEHNRWASDIMQLSYNLTYAFGEVVCQSFIDYNKAYDSVVIETRTYSLWKIADCEQYQNIWHSLASWNVKNTTGNKPL